MPQDTQDLLEQFVDAHKERAVFLVVLKAGELASASRPYAIIANKKLAMRADGHSVERYCTENAIGVLTKCDLQMRIREGGRRDWNVEPLIGHMCGLQVRAWGARGAVSHATQSIAHACPDDACAPPVDHTRVPR